MLNATIITMKQVATSGRIRQNKEVFMQTQVVERKVEEGILAINNLDLNRFVEKLQQPAPRGVEWSKEQAEDADKWYRRFLILGLKYPGVNIVPSKEVDVLWHSHILDMKRYEQDTRRIFGKILYHRPASEGRNMQPQIARTNALMLVEFGEEFTGSLATCDICD